MALTLLQLYGAGTGGTQNAIGSLDIPEDGNILGVQWAAYITADADQESMQAEVSFIATNLININDARGMISSIKTGAMVITTGISFSNINLWAPLNDLNVSGGERIYLHIISTAGVGSFVIAMVHLETRRPTARRSRRRR